MQDKQNAGEQRAIEPEIIEPGQRFSSQGQRRYQGQSFNGVWVMPGIDRDGCLGPAISLALFLICLAQFGVLAGIGFFVFYALGAILGAIHASHRLMEGKPCNAWAWRIGNWIISFALTVWLAGGFAN
ncbi:MAG: hypothetical protein HDQ44_03835 [Desulfovibrio sp.]|nr:hypothetical protein [Desulfovibrio sp.]